MALALKGMRDCVVEVQRGGEEVEDSVEDSAVPTAAVEAAAVA